MAQKVVEEEEDWAQAIDAMVSINLEENLIEDSERNTVDYMEKQDNDVIDMKQRNLEDVHTGDMVAFIK